MNISKIIGTVLVFGGVCYSGYYAVQPFLVGDFSSVAVQKELKSPKVQAKNVKKQTRPEIRYPLPQKGQQFATLIIPRINAILPVVEGADADSLNMGVGHVEISDLPGKDENVLAKNNVVLAGHRDTVFARMGEIKVGDLLVIKIPAGSLTYRFTYRVEKMWVVDKNDRSVIVPRDREIATLVTCYPFHFLGKAPKRYIVQSGLIKTEIEKTEG